MVRAIVSGLKSQTRRVVKPQFAKEAAPVEMPATDPIGGWVVGGHSGIWWCDAAANPDEAMRCPYGQPGDRLWVREAFIHEPADYCWEASVSIPCRPASTVYRADHHGDTCGAGWSPSIHMPRALSRITLEVTGVRVERLQDISEADAQAEGCALECMTPTGDDSGSAIHGPGGYIALWESINGPDSWDANPWVWVVEFRRVS